MNGQRTNRCILKLVSVCSILLLLLPSSGLAAPGAVLAEPWRDDFDGESLDPTWQWINENPERWSLEGGFLTILTTSLGSYEENLLYRTVAEHDFTIETRLLFEPTSNFQFAGLTLFENEDNHVSLGRAFCDNPDGCAGNAIYFDAVFDAGWGENNFATSVDSLNEAYLRMERRGDLVRGLFSYEGITWFEIGTHQLPAEFTVNGVGLVAGQNFTTPEEDIPASFDYFELTEGWGFLPEGSHDYDTGDVPNWACNAGGWAVDPDDRDTDLWVEFNVDGSTLPGWVLAGEYSEALEADGTCAGGTCGFFRAMWDEISAYDPHTITAFAQDIPSGDWVQLSNSSRPLTCRTQDIYTFNQRTRQTVQITDLRDGDEFNPAWSPDGRTVAYDYFGYDGSHGIYLTNLMTGVAAPLEGAQDGGNDAAWSPNGQWVAFDRFPYGDNSLYLVPAVGGEAVLLRGDAISASWSPDGKRLVFTQPSDGLLRTIEMSSGQETALVPGAFPAWSPNGKWIAFEFEEDLWKIPVNLHGELQGDPVRVVGASGWDGHPTWSADSKTIVYHAGIGRDGNIWTVPAAGGMHSFVTGGIEFGDYDPALSRQGGVIAYSSFTTEGQAARGWTTSYTFDMPPGYWTEGTHSYHFSYDGTVSEAVIFEASYQEPRYDDFVLLRGAVLRGRTGGECSNISAIHPDQQTRFHIGFIGVEKTYLDEVADYEDFHVQVAWDGRDPVETVRNEIIPRSSEVDLWAYHCWFTYPSSTTEVLLGNLRVEWSPTNPERITSLRWKNSENLTNSWAHDACPGDLEYFGNSWVNENEGGDPSYFASLVGWGTAGTWQQTGRNIDINSRSIGCPGSADIPVDTDYKLFEGPLKVNVLGVQRTFEFGEIPFDHAVRPFIPRLYPYDGFSLVVHPDLSGQNLVVETTTDCGYGCTVTDWNGTWFAIHNPVTGTGMIVVHAPSPFEAALWIDVDDGSFTNASSVLLLPPAGGFTGSVVETQYMLFYDSGIWSPMLALPSAVSGANLNMADPEYQIFLPLARR